MDLQPRHGEKHTRTRGAGRPSLQKGERAKVAHTHRDPPRGARTQGKCAETSPDLEPEIFITLVEVVFTCGPGKRSDVRGTTHTQDECNLVCGWECRVDKLRRVVLDATRGLTPSSQGKVLIRQAQSIPTYTTRTVTVHTSGSHTLYTSLWRAGVRGAYSTVDQVSVDLRWSVTTCRDSRREDDGAPHPREPIRRLAERHHVQNVHPWQLRQL